MTPADRRTIKSRRLIVTSAITLLAILFVSAVPLSAADKEAAQYGAGLIVNIPFPENVVTPVVREVVQNGLIRGSKEYNKDEYISGASPADSTRVFKGWTEGGKVFYKVRLKALNPRNFKDGNDVGTLAVRYIVQPQGEKNTVLRVDAVFVEDSRRISHPSNGSVENAEYKDIHDRLDAIDSIRTQTLEAEKEKPTLPPPQPASSVIASSIAVQPVSATFEALAASTATNTTAAQTLEEHVHDLRQQLERLVKAPGAPLKSAPFHTASTLQSLPPGTEVLIVISTPYWYGIETHDGQHGWMLRDELEQTP